MMEKLDFFQHLSAELKSSSASQNVKAQAETSKRELKHQSASRNVKAQAEMSKREPTHQSVSQNVKV